MLRSRLLLLLLLAACGHGEPYTHETTPVEGPLDPAVPVRLTYNTAPDVTPSWLPDGSGILYASALGDRGGDRCLMVLPPAGGQARRLLCYHVFNRLPNDSLRILAWAALSPGGRLVYSATTSRRFITDNARVRQIKWGRLGDEAADHQFASAPLDLFGGRYLNGVAFVRWLDEDRFVYRGDFMGVSGGDSVISGRYVVLASFNADSLVRSYIAGTDHASSVTVLPGDTLLFTKNNDTRIYSIALATGVVDTVYDFGPGLIARDVHAVGNRMVAVAGGFTQYLWAQSFQDSVQVDRGGALWLIDRASGAAQALTLDDPSQPGYRYPALSPDGRRLVAQRAEDLYLFEIP